MSGKILINHDLLWLSFQQEKEKKLLNFFSRFTTQHLPISEKQFFFLVFHFFLIFSWDPTKIFKAIKTCWLFATISG